MPSPTWNYTSSSLTLTYVIRVLDSLTATNKTTLPYSYKNVGVFTDALTGTGFVTNPSLLNTGYSISTSSTVMYYGSGIYAITFVDPVVTTIPPNIFGLNGADKTRFIHRFNPFKITLRVFNEINNTTRQTNTVEIPAVTTYSTNNSVNYTVG
jgi:hypothetical protein